MQTCSKVRAVHVGCLRLMVATALALAITTAQRQAVACPNFPDFVPTELSCATCHPGTNSIRNNFALAWREDCANCAASPVCSCSPLQWTACSVRNDDTDGDGFTNDEEMQLVTHPVTTGDVDECRSDVSGIALNDCVPAAACNDQGPPGNFGLRGDFTCTCPAGFEGDGRESGQGCVDIDECEDDDDNDCDDPDSSCLNLTGSFDCPCDPGFVGNGKAGQGCVFENLCEDGPCSPLSTCFPLIGDFECRARPQGDTSAIENFNPCPAGYQGDGVGPNGCQDVDECAVDNGGCSPGVECINLIGGRRCNGCPDQFTGDGVGPDGCQRDPCADCSTFAVCDPTAAQPCSCNIGYTGDGETCVDVDECTTQNLAACSENSTCRNVPGSYLCACDEGYAASGDACVAARCDVVDLNCGERGACDDSSGSPACHCAAGFAGTFPDCEAVVLCTEGESGESSNLTLASEGSGPERGLRPGLPPPPSSRLLAAGVSYPLPAGVAPTAQSSSLSGGCSLRSSATPSVGGLLSMLAAWGLLRRRRNRSVDSGGRRRRPLLSLALLSLALVFGGCSEGDGSGNPTDGAAATSGSGAGNGGDGGDAGSNDAGANAGTGGITMAGSGGAGGSDPVNCVTAGTGGTGGSGNPPAVGTCSHSRECAVDEWCNPSGNACQPRQVEGEALTLEDVFSIVGEIGCPSCHLPGGEGDLDVSGSGLNMQLHDFQRAYRSLVAGGANCQGGLRRLCVDDPKSSRLISQVFLGATETVESVAFTEWSDVQLQQILRWIARGAPRSGSCGNFIRETGEQCDQGPSPETRCGYGLDECSLCNPDCTTAAAVPGPRCGDGVLDAAFEACDDGNTALEPVGVNGGFTCGPTCTLVAGAVP